MNNYCKNCGCSIGVDFYSRLCDKCRRQQGEESLFENKEFWNRLAKGKI